MHPGGFEPPTARFVAEYSIQLSYGCIGKIYFIADIDTATKAISSKKSFLTIITDDYGEYGASGRIRTSDRSVRSRVLYPAELRMHRETYFTADFLIPLLKPYQVRDGASGRIRTSDRSVRSRVLYPAELRMHRETYFTADFLIPLLKPYQVRDGASGRIRTSDRSVRSRVLYPAELRMQMAVRRGFEPRMQLLTAYSLSRGAPSASRPPHHTPLTSASKNLFIAHRRCVAHILLSETYKSNNFSHTFIVCTLHAQLVCKNVKKSVLSTEKRRSGR